MTTTSGPSSALGVQAGQAVQEVGWDEDSDEELRSGLEAACGSELLDEDADEVVDVVLLWWREDDGDLVDALRPLGCAIDEFGAPGYPPLRLRGAAGGRL